MTIFSEEPHSRQMERLMTAVPNFKPRGVGFRFAETQITVITASMPEILTAAMRQIRCPPFLKRFNEYIESEESIMTFSNEKHMAMFVLAVKNAERENYALLSAIYLLNDCYALHPELEDYFDFNGFGEHIAEEYGGKFVGGNFIYNDTDTSLLDILYQDKPMTMGEI